jgi:hypothetical protein
MDATQGQAVPGGAHPILLIAATIFDEWMWLTHGHIEIAASDFFSDLTIEVTARAEPSSWIWLLPTHSGRSCLTRKEVLPRREFCCQVQPNFFVTSFLLRRISKYGEVEDRSADLRK